MRPHEGMIVRFYRAAVRLLLPRRVARAVGDQMVTMFGDALRDLDGWARWRFARRAGVDLVVEAVRGRWAADAAEDAARGRLRDLAADLGGDLRIAMRSLARRPAFTAVVVATLTLGIGLNSAMFSFVNGLLLRPLPYADPGRLVQLTETARDFGTIDLSLPDFAVWQSETRVFEGMFAFDDQGFLIDAPDAAVGARVEGAVVTPGFLAVLGLEPVLGRAFTPEEGLPGADAVVLISHRLWSERYGADAGVLGTSLLLSGRARTVVGVAPRGFHFPEVADVWVPLAFDVARADPFDYGYDAIARLRPGFGVDDARADGRRAVEVIRAAYPAEKAGLGTDAYTLRFADVPLGLAAASLVALVAVVLVLLVACSNVASLLAARGEERRGEMAARHALGASRMRIARHVLAECAVLAAVGCVGAVAVAVGATGLFDRVLPAEHPYWLTFELDAAVLAWTLLTGTVTCIAIGVPPALQATRAGSLGSAHGTRVVRGSGRWLVGAQVTVAALMVVVATVALRTLGLIQATDVGLDPRDVVVQEVILPPWEYPTEAGRSETGRRIVEGVAATPGVASAALVESLPFVGGSVEVAVEPEGGQGGVLPVARLNAASTAYFATMGIALERGRAPSEAEERDGMPVAVVSAALANRLWPGRDPIGRRVRHSEPGGRSPTVGAGQPWLTVVGVARDVRSEGPGQPVRGELYLPWGEGGPVSVIVVARTDGDAREAVPTVRAAIAERAPGGSFAEPTTLEDALGFSTWIERLASRSIGWLAALALGLAALGVHGLVTQWTRRRTREVGVRVALGASAGRIQRAVTRDALLLIGPGVVIGLGAGAVASVAASRALPWLASPDVGTVALSGLVMVAAGGLASWLPARAASRADPVEALRSA